MLERSADGVHFAPLATFAAGISTYTDVLPEPLRGWFYRVAATNEFGASEFSNIEPLRTSSIGPPGPPAVVR